MLLILNVLALAGTAAVMYMCALQGVFRAGMTLAACVLAGAAAFGLFGPAAGLLGADNSNSVWYYAGDALSLWAIFCVVFLGLRGLGEMFFKNEPAFPTLADRIGGGVLGFAAGYLAVGICLVLAQMLPMPPTILGYSPFLYDGKNNAVTEGDRLWFRWDRGTLALFGWLSARSLGSEEHLLFNRYGELYPMAKADSDGAPAPDEKAEAPRPAAKAHPDADDMLYYHWYRRWEYIRWRRCGAQGPIPREPEIMKAGGPGQPPGSPLKLNRDIRTDDVTLRITRIERPEQVVDFPDVRRGDQEIFLVLTLSFWPTGEVPVRVDSKQFVLVPELGRRLTDPLVYGLARLGRPDPVIEDRAKTPSETTPRNLRFGIPEDKARGHYLMDGAAFRFTEKSQKEERAFIYTIPADLDDSKLRFLFEPASAVSPGEADGPAPPDAPSGNPKRPD
jgi:hypothetical protein